MKFVDEFKEFAMKGNVVDMAVGIIIGGAFGTIVSSLVKDIIMPPIGVVLGGVDFSNLTLTIKQASEGAEAVVMRYGLFINNIIDFLIVALAIFVVIKAMNNMRSKEEEPSDPTDKECVYCISKIPVAASKCKFCSSNVE